MICPKGTNHAGECRGPLCCGEAAKLVHQVEPIQVVPLFDNPAVDKLAVDKLAVDNTIDIDAGNGGFLFRAL